MKFFAKLKRHAAIAGANFEAMFADMDTIPPFPAAAARLMNELNRPDAQIEEFATIIATAPDLSAKILQAVNSPMVAPRFPIKDIHQAVSLLGIDHIKQIATAHLVRKAIPIPEDSLFDQEAFWSDSLRMALMAREMARITNPGDMEEAFTAALLADMALPILLSAWQDYYEPIVEEWQESELSLSEIEREHFKWDHAQAGAWIAKSWELPDELVCLIGVHNLTAEETENAGLKGTAAEPLRIASGLSSILRPQKSRSESMWDEAVNTLGLTPEQFSDAIHRSVESFDGVRKLFDVANISSDESFKLLTEVIEERG